LEAKHIAATLAWIASGAPLYRQQRADDPPQHLVAYFLLYDQAQHELLLVDHKKAGLWLPSGGHVEPDEPPHVTVQREVTEELGVTAHFFTSDVPPIPLFVTVTPTVGSVARHVDVSLWYVLRGDAGRLPWYDAGEFYQVAWFALDALPRDRCEPHLARFAAKLLLSSNNGLNCKLRERHVF
jgi:8-oxo-dGTP pyrophosphatase MutT (NUDIX family)